MLCTPEIPRITVGVDTVKYAWPLGHLSVSNTLRTSAASGRLHLGTEITAWPAISTKPTAEIVVASHGPRGAGRLTRGVGRWIYSWSDGGACLFAEGPLSPIGLAPVADLADGARQAAEMFEALFTDAAGVVSRIPAQLQRVDLAADVRFDHGESGIALLDELGGVRTRWKTHLRKGSDGRTETVYLTRNGRSDAVILRAYDKSKDLGETPGVIVRMERQLRWVGRDRPGIDDVTDPGAMWSSGIEALADAEPPPLTIEEVLLALDLPAPVTDRNPGLNDRRIGSWMQWRTSGKLAFSPSMRKRRVREARALDRRVRDAQGVRLHVAEAYRLVLGAWAEHPR